MEGIGRYNLGKKIGSGGMATVYVAEDTVLRRKVAVKQIHPHLLEHPQALKRFENEARAIASLSHENLIGLFDYGIQNSTRFLVMELVDGTNLEILCERTGVLPNLITLKIFVNVFAGLAAAHQRSVLHRDIKPSNILIGTDGSVRIADFGIASMLNSEALTLTGTFIGSPYFISPEQGQGKKATAKSDVFAAGEALYCCMTGKVPHDGDNPHSIIYSIIHDRPVEPSALVPGTLPELQELCFRCLEKDPGIRPDAAQCLRDLRSALIAYSCEECSDRIARFMKDPENYISEEQAELKGHFSQKAQEEAGKRRWVEVVRMLSLAEPFGKLSSRDQLLMKKAGVRMRTGRSLKYAAVVLSMLVVAIAGFFGISQVSERKRDISSRLQTLGDTTGIQEQHAESLDPDRISSAQGLAGKTADKKPVTRRALSEDVVPSHTVRSSAKSPQSPPERQEDLSPGYAIVKTNPPFADIYVNNMPVGTTPLENVIPLAGKLHEVRIVKERYLRVDTAVVISPGDTVSLLFALQKSR